MYNPPSHYLYLSTSYLSTSYLSTIPATCLSATCLPCTCLPYQLLVYQLLVYQLVVYQLYVIYVLLLCVVYLPPPTSNLWIIGVVLGSIAGAIILVWLCLFVYIKCTRRPRNWAEEGKTSANQLPASLYTGGKIEDDKQVNNLVSKVNDSHFC